MGRTHLEYLEEILNSKNASDYLTGYQTMTIDALAELLSFCPYERLCELAQADREGRCVVLPVKPGTPVWSTAFCKVDDDGTEHPTYPWPFDIGMANEWGTEWFLTQADAEAALRREQDG